MSARALGCGLFRIEMRKGWIVFRCAAAHPSMPAM